MSLTVLKVGLILIFAGCANLSQVLNQMSIKEPRASVVDARLKGLNFDQVDLLFDINIDNPNSIGITLDGFDYDLQFNDNSFLSGEQKKTINIAAQGSSRIDFPVSLKFADIYNMFRSLQSLTVRVIN
jgi:LEA14-like dessication related protein